MSGCSVGEGRSKNTFIMGQHFASTDYAFGSTLIYTLCQPLIQTFFIFGQRFTNFLIQQWPNDSVKHYSNNQNGFHNVAPPKFLPRLLPRFLKLLLIKCSLWKHIIIYLKGDYHPQTSSVTNERHVSVLCTCLETDKQTG